MKTFRIALVKSHPPLEVMNRRCPIPESYRYDWEPLGLKMLAHSIMSRLPAARTRVWHLMDEEDDEAFLAYVSGERPQLIGFSEIDLLVTEVNRLAAEVRRILPSIFIIVGGKQTSLLRAGDRFPFSGVDMGIRGSGSSGLCELVERLQSGNLTMEGIKGAVYPGSSGECLEGDAMAEYEVPPDIFEARKIPVERHGFEEYYFRRQRMLPFPLNGEDEVRTASLYTGAGCPHRCEICQSPVEYGAARESRTREAERVAEEMEWLARTYGVNQFFSLEPNLDLENLSRLYVHAEKRGMGKMPITGFVRAPDILRAHRNGILRTLIDHGVRSLSVGLDAAQDSAAWKGMEETLNICDQLGILIMGTLVGDTTLDRRAFEGVLKRVESLPIAAIDVRLSIALRHTPFYNRAEKFLLFHPDRDPRYFELQNYRYQTLQREGGITPEESYAAVNGFLRSFYRSEANANRVIVHIGKHPDSARFFRALYSEEESNHGSSAGVRRILSAADRALS